MPDEGACVELGIAWSQKKFTGNKKIIIGLRTGNSKAFYDNAFNPMLRGCFDYLTGSEDELIDILKTNNKQNT